MSGSCCLVKNGTVPFSTAPFLIESPFLLHTFEARNWTIYEYSTFNNYPINLFDSVFYNSWHTNDGSA